VHLRQDARVFEMSHAHVVRGKREPGAIGLQDAFGNLIAQPDEVACAVEDTAARIEAIRNL